MNDYDGLRVLKKLLSHKSFNDLKETPPEKPSEADSGDLGIKLVDVEPSMERQADDEMVDEGCKIPSWINCEFYIGGGGSVILRTKDGIETALVTIGETDDVKKMSLTLI